METIELLTIAAIILGPILAVQAQKYIEVASERKRRKLDIFHTLMATRASRVSINHVRALNMIDIEFYGRKYFGIRSQSKKEKLVLTAWDNYRDHLNNKDPNDASNLWIEKGDELFTKLLFTISRALNYEFEEVQLKRGCYSPIAHGDLELDSLNIRKGLTKILSGEKPIPVKLINQPESTENQ
jgi:hypothetical protein